MHACVVSFTAVPPCLVYPLDGRRKASLMKYLLDSTRDIICDQSGGTLASQYYQEILPAQLIVRGWYRGP